MSDITKWSKVKTPLTVGSAGGEMKGTCEKTPLTVGKTGDMHGTKPGNAGAHGRMGGEMIGTRTKNPGKLGS